KWQAGVVCVVLMALLAPVALASDYIGGGPYTVDYPLPSSLQPDTVVPSYDNLIQDATVNFETGAELAAWGNSITAIDGSVLNINNISVGDFSTIFVTDDSVVNVNGGVFGTEAYLSVVGDEKYNADVTIHGTYFEIDGFDITADPLPNDVIFEDGKYFLPNNVVSVLDENGVSLFDIPVQCAVEGTSRTYVKLGAAPSVIDVIVDIKPGSDDNIINLGAKGVIPVAILSDATFDAPTLVDPDSLFLGGAKVAVRGKNDKSLSHAEDINGDGYVDLVCQFDSDNFEPDVVQEGPVHLDGNLYDGTLIEGEDWIVIVPQ
ncbi:MAG: hypothetical protein ACYTGA_10570, partial [Planctomycetota bacterium]